MKTFITVSALFFLLVSCKSETLQTVYNEASKALSKDKTPSREQVALGLKEALKVSIERGAEELARSGGYSKNEAVKIFLPEEVRAIESKLQKLGLGRVTDRLTLKMNEAAENAAKQSIPIFKEAIVSMSFQDVMKVLTGKEHEATNYLRSETSPKILSTFKPDIKKALEQVGAPKIWQEIFSRYNSIPFVKKVETDLVSYVAEEALKGLFYKVSQKEESIREKLSSRTTPLLKYVFGYADRLKSQNN